MGVTTTKTAYYEQQYDLESEEDILEKELAFLVRNLNLAKAIYYATDQPEQQILKEAYCTGWFPTITFDINTRRYSCPPHRIRDVPLWETMKTYMASIRDTGISIAAVRHELRAIAIAIRALTINETLNAYYNQNPIVTPKSQSSMLRFSASTTNNKHWSFVNDTPITSPASSGMPSFHK